jgi:hypothetical protein
VLQVAAEQDQQRRYLPQSAFVSIIPDKVE